MCGGGGSSGPSPFQQSVQQQQLVQQSQADAARLAEQQREFDVQQVQTQTQIANTRALQAQQKAEADQQAELTNNWETGRAASLADATGKIDNAFASFTPDYYKGFTKDYAAHYQPQVDQQFGAASNRMVFGLARSGNLNSQTAANQIGDLATQKGTAEADISNAATGASNTLQANALTSKQNLMSQASSSATIGSPVTPGSVDGVNSGLTTLNNNVQRLGTQAGDVVTTLQATPTYSSLGTLFGAAAGGAGAYATGTNNANYAAAYNAGVAGGVGAANPTTASSGSVR